jgi:cellulose 1,4-beta-cellobiosidase
MDVDPGTSRYPDNNAGARYGTGYCEAPCPTDIKFIRGIANSPGWKPQKNERNSGNGKYTPHVCDKFEQVRSNGRECDYSVSWEGAE